MFFIKLTHVMLGGFGVRCVQWFAMGSEITQEHTYEQERDWYYHRKG